jgi:hypothetical protein
MTEVDKFFPCVLHGVADGDKLPVVENNGEGNNNHDDREDEGKSEQAAGKV